MIRTKKHSVEPQKVSEVAPATQRERIGRSNDIVKAIMKNDLMKPSITAPDNTIERQIASEKKLKKLRVMREMRSSLQNQLKEKDMRKMREMLQNKIPDIQGSFGYPPFNANVNTSASSSYKSQHMKSWEEQMRIKKQRIENEKKDDAMLREKFEREYLDQRKMDMNAKQSKNQVSF